MTVLFFEGFEGTTTLADLINRGWSTASSWNFSTAARTGLRALSRSTTSQLILIVEPGDRNARMIAGMATLRAAAISITTSLTIRDNTGANIAVLTITSSDTLTLTVLGTLRATVSLATAGFVSVNAWNYLELNVLAHATTGTVRVQINGVAVSAFDFNGNTGANTLERVVIDTFGAVTLSYIDDVYVANGAGSTGNTFLGDVAVQPLYPTGAGNSTQFAVTGAAANWQAVDETVRSATDFVSDSVVGELDLYALGDLPATVSAVHGVRVLSFWSKSDAGARTAAIPVRSGGTTDDGADLVPTTSYAYAVRRLTTNPVTGAAWTVAEVNALEAGVKVVA